jgi:hypothetical protein
MTRNSLGFGVMVSVFLSSTLIVWTFFIEQKLSTEIGVFQESSTMSVGLGHAEKPTAAIRAGGPDSRPLTDILSHAAEVHKVQITALTLDPESRIRDLTTDILDVKGTYPAIKALLADISNAHNGVAIRQVTLRRPNQSSDVEGRVTFVVKSDPRP